MIEFFNLARNEAFYTTQLPSLPERVLWLIWLRSSFFFFLIWMEDLGNKKKFTKR